MKSGFIFLCLVLMVGCVHGGKFRGALLDIDLRTPEQIVAYKQEASVIYTGKTGASGVKLKPESVGILKPVFSFLSVVKGRIRFFSFELSHRVDKEQNNE